MSLIVFADGAAKGNPGPGGWGVIIVTQTGHVTELGGAESHTTNNRMELMAAIEALQHLRGRPGPIALHTDSAYVIRGIREWIHRWRQRGWKTSEGADVVNRDLWEKLAALADARGKDGKVDWRYVRGHAGIPGNERVDAIANAQAQGKAARLYHGPLVRYTIPVLDVPDDTSLPTRDGTPSSRPRKGKPHSYLSLVDGTVARHATWAECERRVKGRSGARYKKAMSPADERHILGEWGHSPSDLE